MSAIEALRDKISLEANDLHSLQRDLSRNMNSRRQFAHQYSENDLVHKELERLDNDAKVYKLIGPALIRQDKVEAISNVAKRMGFIEHETSRLDNAIKGLESKQDGKQKVVSVSHMINKVIVCN
uniref:Prefoldin n=1 Tax=Micromonas pusilla TaxID=38833 RepID=A0A6U2E918_MICPS|mmetsp:Transcript_7563/g.29855  ORF Transcript_7563/g.29855 Transcript_7563/m.29855 type:complete len:124 (+) Transcript_7563:176-547(+)